MNLFFNKVICIELFAKVHSHSCHKAIIISTFHKIRMSFIRRWKVQQILANDRVHLISQRWKDKLNYSCHVSGFRSIACDTMKLRNKLNFILWSSKFIIINLRLKLFCFICGNCHAAAKRWNKKTAETGWNKLNLHVFTLKNCSRGKLFISFEF